MIFGKKKATQNAHAFAQEAIAELKTQMQQLRNEQMAQAQNIVKIREIVNSIHTLERANFFTIRRDFREEKENKKVYWGGYLWLRGIFV